MGPGIMLVYKKKLCLEFVSNLKYNHKCELDQFNTKNNMHATLHLNSIPFVFRRDIPVN